MRPMRLSSRCMAVRTDAQQIPLLLPRLPALVDNSEHHFFHGLTLDPEPYPSVSLRLVSRGLFRRALLRL